MSGAVKYCKADTISGKIKRIEILSVLKKGDGDGISSISFIGGIAAVYERFTHEIRAEQDAGRSQIGKRTFPAICHARQENLYATYRTADNEFWSNLARESQQEFKRSGTEGKCIEARELIIALPEVYTQYEPQQVLEDFTEEFRKRYGVECVSALHHNKRKTNDHIHLMFRERKLLAEPEVKIASRSHAKNPLTEKADRQRKTAAMVLPIHGFYCRKRGKVSNSIYP